MAISGDQYKQTLAQWPSGVTIVTSRAGDRVQGMTGSSFNEGSLNPPLVLICADKSTITNDLIQASGVFSVSILAKGQEDLSNRFASKKHERERFDGLNCDDGETGCPRIPGAVAWLDCKIEQSVDAGDHLVHIGEIQAAEITDRPPLIYFRQSYHGVT